LGDLLTEWTHCLPPLFGKDYLITLGNLGVGVKPRKPLIIHRIGN
jgi:hypothetical protein